MLPKFLTLSTKILCFLATRLANIARRACQLAIGDKKTSGFHEVPYISEFNVQGLSKG